MPLISGLRILNGLTVGNVNATCLESLLQNDSKKADFAGIIESPGYACLLSGSNTATFALTRSNTAMNELFTDTTAGCVALSTPEFANNFAYSGCAFNYAMTNDFALCRFANSAPAIRCSMAQGTTFVCCLTSSNTNIARFIACPFFRCYVMRCQTTMCGLMANQNVAAYFYADPVAKTCISENTTQVCNAFGTLPWVDYSLTPGITQPLLQCLCLGNHAFTSPLSSFCYIRNACALNVLLNTPACSSLSSSCLFDCFSKSCFGILCATQEINSGNTMFLTCLYQTNSCRQYICMAANGEFISSVQRPGYSNTWNCHIFNVGTETSGRYFNLKDSQIACYSIAMYPRNANNISCQIRISMLCDFGLTTNDNCDVTMMNCFIASRDCVITSSNNGNFLLFGPGTGSRVYAFSDMCGGNSARYPYTPANPTVALSLTMSAAQSCGFCVNRGVWWSCDQGLNWCRLTFCLPNTFFQLACFTNAWSIACCNPTSDTVAVSLTSGWTCANTFWIGWTAGPSACGAWMWMSGHVYGCVGANNTPVIKSIKNSAPIPVALTTWCCGFFAGVGFDCCTCNFGTNHVLNNCFYCFNHQVTHIVGHICCECGNTYATYMSTGAGVCFGSTSASCTMSLGNNCGACCVYQCVNAALSIAGGAAGSGSLILVRCSCCPNNRIKSLLAGYGGGSRSSGTGSCAINIPMGATLGSHQIIEYCVSGGTSSASVFNTSTIGPSGCMRGVGGVWAVANVVYFSPMNAQNCDNSPSTNCCFASLQFLALQLGNCPACSFNGTGVCGTDFAFYNVNSIRGQIACGDQVTSGSSLACNIDQWALPHTVYVNQERCTFVFIKPQGTCCCDGFYIMSSPPTSCFYANNAPLLCHYLECSHKWAGTNIYSFLPTCMNLCTICSVHRGTFSTLCDMALYKVPTGDGLQMISFPKGYAVFGNENCCCGYLFQLHCNNPNQTSWCMRGFDTACPLLNEGIRIMCANCVAGFGCLHILASCCITQFNCSYLYSYSNPPSIIETPKGYPALVYPFPIASPAFYANGNSFCMCTIGIKFVDFF